MVDFFLVNVCLVLGVGGVVVLGIVILVVKWFIDRVISLWDEDDIKGDSWKELSLFKVILYL